VTDAVGQLAAFIRKRRSDPCPGLLVFRLKFAQPSLNVRKKVRIIAMWAGQRGNRSRQGSEALCIQIDAGVDFAPRCWAVEFQQCHRTRPPKPEGLPRGDFKFVTADLAAPVSRTTKPPNHVMNTSKDGRQSKKEAPTGGNRGFLGSFWGELVRERLPSRGGC
jgi:hypothetical protein